MAVTSIMQTSLVDDVSQVVITDIVQDIDAGVFTRAIRVYGPPDEVGNKPLQFTLQMSSVNHDDIELVAPSSMF